MEIIKLIPRQRWRIVFRYNDNWQAGIYFPEYISMEQINFLEKHDSPELFYLIRGRIILVISSDLREIKEVEMKPGNIYIINEWHNAYRPNGVDGLALVIEKPDIKTEYAKLK